MFSSTRIRSQKMKFDIFLETKFPIFPIRIIPQGEVKYPLWGPKKMRAKCRVLFEIFPESMFFLPVFSLK